MDTSLEGRLARLEESVGRLVERVERLERGRAPAAPERERRREPEAGWQPAAMASVMAEATDEALASRGPPAAAEADRGPEGEAAWSPSLELEDLLGGRVLAWVGGLAILLGVVFFLVMAVSRGWIDEPTRVVLAFVGSTALLAVGLYLYERRGRTDAAIAAVAASIAALYASLTAATALYELVSPTLGLAVALLIGATATAIAVRWASPLIGALGILGALVSPVLVDAPTTGVTLAFMAIALLAATGVLLWQRWDWLAAGAFLVSAPQLLAWVGDTYDENLVLTLLVLLGFWALYVVAAIGYELRAPSGRFRPSSALLLLADALLVSVAGWAVLDDTGHDDLATAWVLLLAVAYVVLGVAVRPSGVNDEIANLSIAVGIALSAVGLSLALSGPALVTAWAAEAAILAWLGRRTGDARGRLAALAFLALAGAHVLVFEAPPDALAHGVDSLWRAALAVAVFALAAIFVRREFGDGPRDLRLALEAAAGAALVYLPSIAIVDLTTRGEGLEPGQTPQVLLSAFWSVTGLAAVLYGLLRDDRRFRIAGLALLGVAVAKVYSYDLAALDEIYRVLSFIALGLLLLAGAFAYQRLRRQPTS